MLHDRNLTSRADGQMDADKAFDGSRGGGLGVYLAEVVTGLRARGIDVSTIEFDPDAIGNENISAGSYRLRGFRFRYRLDTVRAFHELVRQHRPDIIHLQGVSLPSLLSWSARQCPVICTLHDVGMLCFRGSRLNMRRELCSRAVGIGCLTNGCYRLGEKESILIDLMRIILHVRYLKQLRSRSRVLVPSGYMQQALVDNGFDLDNVEVTPLFSRYSYEAKSIDGAKGVPQILFVGRLDHDKGVEQFIRALTLLREERWQAVVVGEGSQSTEARALTVAMGINERVRFAGVASGTALATHYCECDLVVFSSILPESFGLVGVEAMSFGKPVVAFSSGGVTQWLHDGVNGLLAPHGDVACLARQVSRLLIDHSLRRRLGQEARAAVLREFTLDRHLDQLQQVYQRVLEPQTEN